MTEKWPAGKAMAERIGGRRRSIFSSGYGDTIAFGVIPVTNVA
jgi:hypothetical protein